MKIKRKRKKMKKGGKGGKRSVDPGEAVELELHTAGGAFGAVAPGGGTITTESPASVSSGGGGGGHVGSGFGFGSPLSARMLGTGKVRSVSAGRGRSRSRDFRNTPRMAAELLAESSPSRGIRNRKGKACEIRSWG